MDPKQALLMQMDEVAQGRRRLMALARAKPQGWKRDYAAARLSIHDHIATVSQLGAAYARERGGGPLEQRFRDHLAHLRQGVASHEARWPVIIVTTDNDAYRASAERIEALFAEFNAFVRGMLRD